MPGTSCRTATSPGAKTVILDGGPRTSQPVTGLTAGATYYFRVEAYNSSGQMSVPSPDVTYKVPATTAADTTPPTITSRAPAAGATNVATTASAVVGFSEAMNTSTLTASTVLLLRGTTAVTASR